MIRISQESPTSRKEREKWGTLGFFMIKSGPPAKKREKLQYIHRKSGAAGIGARAGSMGVEQFSILCLWRARTGAGERAEAGETEALCATKLLSASDRNPQPLKTAKAGATSEVVVHKTKRLGQSAFEKLAASPSNAGTILANSGP